MIKDLTPEQQAKIPVYLERFRECGLSTVPCDKKKAEDAVRAAYTVQGKEQPKYVFWFTNPMKASLAMLAIEQDLVNDVETQEEFDKFLTESESKIKKVADVVSSINFGSFSAYWIAFYCFIAQQLPVEKKDRADEVMEEIVKNCGAFYTTTNCIIFSEKPSEIHFNSEKRLHNFQGPALAYADGFELYYFNGIKVTKELAEKPVSLFTKDDIVKETNVDIRREVIRKIGNQKMVELLNYKVIDSKMIDDIFYELITFDIGDGRDRPHLKFPNATNLEITHIEGVPPDVKTVEAALCFRNGLSTYKKPEVLT